MAAPLILRVITDARQAFKTNAELVGSYTAIGDVALKNAPNFAAAAQAQVAANTKVIQSQRLLLAETIKLQQVTVAGSDQRAAANVALAASQANLNRALGVSTVGLARTGAAAKEAERDLGKLTRGALAGSGLFAVLGRSLAFASSGFIAVAAGSTLLAESIRSALDLAATQRQVEAQLKTTGKTWEQYGDQIQEADVKLSHISGFDDSDLLQSFGYIFRASGNVAQSLRLNAVAADIARGRHIALSSAALALGKALGGSETALRRLGIIVPKNLSTMEALAFVQKKFAGQALAGATAADRFHAALVNTGEVIGTALLPTFDRLVTQLGDWLAKANETGRIQRDANEAVKIAGQLFHTLGGIIGVVDKVTGSFANTLRIILTLRIASVIGGWVGNLGKLTLAWRGVAVAATEAAVAERAALGVGGAVAGGAAVAGRLGVAERVGLYTGAGVAARTGAGLLGGKVGFLRGLGAATFAASATLPPGIQAHPSEKVVGGWKFYSIDHGQHWTRGPYVGYASTVTPFDFSNALLGSSPLTGQRRGGGKNTAEPFAGATPIRQYAVFKLNTTEQLLQAQAALTASTADDVKLAKEIIARIKRLMNLGKLHGKALIQALEAEAAALGTIRSAASEAKAEAQAAAAKAKQARETYNIPIGLQVAQASLEAYGKDTTAVLQKIIAAAQRAIASGKKSGAGLVAAYGVIQSAQQALVAQLSAIPIRLQLDLAKEQARGTDQTGTLRKMKAALELALKKAKGNYEAQIAILNQIASINSQLGSSAASALGSFKQLNINKIAKSLHLTVEQAKALRSQLSQIGPGGTVPGQGVGAYGYAIAGHRPIVIHNSVDIDGQQVESRTRHHRNKRKRRNSSQRRGPYAGADD